MPTYDEVNFDPPAPVGQVILRSQETGTTVRDTSLLLDTGADITFLPRSAVEQLGVLPIPDVRYELMGFDGTRSFTEAVLLDVVFLNRAFRGRYLLIEEERGIMGRDILNHVTLLLDGPRRAWSESL